MMEKMKTSRGLRNNNPGNIRLSTVKYIGEVRPSKDKSFKTFQSMAYGYRAMFVVLRTYYNNYRLNTIAKMINRWAPTNENDTSAYINTVSRLSGVDKSAVLKFDRATMVKVVAAMSYVENGAHADMVSVEKGWELL